jgi:hypothetical protein
MHGSRHSLVILERMLRTLTALLYGAVLTALAILAAGAGHGTHVLIGLSSAPLGLLGPEAAAIGALILWGTVGGLLAWLPPVRRRRVVIPILTLHYTSALVLASTPSFGDWAAIGRSVPALGELLLIWGAIYAAGQFVIWRSALR